MRKLFCVALLGVVWGLTGCMVSTSDPGSGDGTAATNQQAASANACQYRCSKCPPNQICALSCVAQGNCNGCTQLMLCIRGYHFDSTSCRCLPDTPEAGLACGNGHCSHGEYCCNPSCGMCAPIGAMCPMIACSPTN